ncbi:hypothetical protein LSCM1_05065 [Leishmania martiniquensis]|uniref:EF-hand domain-containing protein n=1 Tax=Leishmania martiniquensis TaxID=1580590 RepID=A0A836H1J4_9TRYP|nr:hypothetical protein LSCM1_05065 [Leishmania martiniquensis]
MAATVKRQLSGCGWRLSRGACAPPAGSLHWGGLSHTTAGAASSAAGARAVVPPASSRGFASPSSLLLCPRRFLWNPFASGATNSVSAAHNTEKQRNAERHEQLAGNAPHSADLEQLSDACLDLLKACSGNAVGSPVPDTLDELARDRILILVRVLLHEHHRPPAEQFDLVYAALCLPAVQRRRQVQRCLFVVLRSVVPEALYRVFESVDLVVAQADERSLRQRDVLRTFTHAQLGELQVPGGLAAEEVLSVYAEDMKAMFPALVSCPAWQVMERDAVTIALKAKLFALLGHLCAEFDEDKTGKVRLADLRSTAERALGKEQASRLLHGAQADKDGMIAYAQLAALLTRPPQRKSVTAEREGERG